ncbi:M23 family metallopeptidase [Streptomyces griseoflavus]|uniref:M23 peptidase domain-containing protein n=1 Tax=Streptomyces griseoflavus Tu4000 TaxID=467200 RepID=D9XNG9_9ACTN|nr:M23 peptidase domain-containing protein [Streptomyces griseoflavus Tu4000]
MAEGTFLVREQDADEPAVGEGASSRPDRAGRAGRRPRRRGPGPFTLVVMPSLVAVAGVSTFLALRSDHLSPGPSGGSGVTDTVGGKVNGSYVPWLREATRDCPVVTAAVLAAQIDRLSEWNDDTPSVSRQGIARFTDAQWKKWGRDDNGNGRSSPHDPVDAIMALGRQDCSLVREVTTLRTRGTVNGDLVDLTLAAHTLGTDAVARAGRVPAAARGVLDEVEARLARYESLVRQNPEATGGPTASALMSAPLHTPTVTSAFGTREHPLTGVTKLHTGVDFGGPRGALVSAARAGRVEFAGMTPAYGNRVVIHHGTIGGKRLETTYSHLSAVLVAPGQSVSVGSPVGRVGSTGLSTGPHLHFEVLLDGQYVDPMPWLRGPTG